MTHAVFSAADLAARQRTSGKLYEEMLRVPALSAGRYVLAAGAEDRQQPHGQDEIYVVMAGRADLEVEGERRALGPGDLVYVAAGARHRFVDIREPLELLVVFAPAES